MHQNKILRCIPSSKGYPLLGDTVSVSYDIVNSCKQTGSCVQCPRKMGIDVTAFGLPILLTSQQREREKEGGKKLPRKGMGCRVFPDVDRTGRSKAVTSLPILLGHYRQLPKYFTMQEMELNEDGKSGCTYDSCASSAGISYVQKFSDR